MNVELFPCSGGMAEGFRRAGVRFDIAFDKDTDACASYEANLGHRPIQIDVSDLLRMVRLGWLPSNYGSPAVRLLVADPPCTPWSRAGKREGTADERDMLLETVALIDALRPTCWLIANVPGLDDSDHWKAVVQPVIGGFAQRAGYCVDYASIDAADYGVPQHRVRPFWFGHPKGTACIDWPHPTHCAPPVLTGVGLKPWVTCREALRYLSPEELGRPVRLRYRGSQSKEPARAGRKPRASSADAPAGVVTTGSNGDGNVLVTNAKHPPVDPDGPSTTIRGGGSGHSAPQVLLAAPHARHPINKSDEPSFTIKTNGGRASQASSMLDLSERLPDPNRPPVSPDEPFRTVTKGSEYQTGIEWPWERPSLTVTADPNGRMGAPGRHGKSSLSQPDAVVLSERAASILQGFPDGWLFSGRTKRSRWSQLGQAMPPPLAEAVARSIVAWAAKHEVALTIGREAA